MSWYSGGWLSVSWFNIDWFKLAVSGVEHALAGAITAISTLVGNLYGAIVPVSFVAAVPKRMIGVVHSRNRRRR